MYEIIKEIFGLDFDEVVFIDDINRVAEVCKSLRSGFIGSSCSMPHNYQREEMVATGVRYMVNKFTDINEELIYEADNHLFSADYWK